MAAWHPVANAHAAEWIFRQGALGSPYAVVRRFAFGDPNRPDVWFRVVTWAPDSAGRELIGWCRSLEAAASAGWDHRCAFESWRHHMAATRTDVKTMTERRPAAAELLRFYRSELRRSPRAATMDGRARGSARDRDRNEFRRVDDRVRAGR